MFDQIVKSLARFSTRLPDEVVGVVDAAHVFLREHGDEAPRVFVQLGGPIQGAFLYSHELAVEKIRKRWPWLSAKQCEAAAFLLGARVSAATRHPGGLSFKAKNWVRDGNNSEYSWRSPT